ncbi:MAG: hypothetical protein R2856_37075 [Caldilineaceae bacterium]
MEQYVAQADTALSAMSVSDAEYPRLQAEYLVYRGAALFRRQSYADMAETLAQALTSVHLLDDFMAASLYFLHMHMSFAQGRETEAIKMGEQALSTHTRARFGAGVVSLQREMVKWAMRAAISPRPTAVCKRCTATALRWFDEPARIRVDLFVRRRKQLLAG